MNVRCHRCGTVEEVEAAAAMGWSGVLIPGAGVHRNFCDCCVSELLEAMKPPWVEKVVDETPSDE